MTSVFHMGMSPLELSLEMSKEPTRALSGEAPRVSTPPDKVWKREPDKSLISPTPQNEEYSRQREENQTPQKTYTPKGEQKPPYAPGLTINTTA